MKSRKNTGSFSGKGYYIALILCAVAIGISGYLYYQNANKSDTQLQDPGASQVAPNLNGEDLPAGATQPGLNDAAGDSGAVKTPLKTGMPLAGQTVGEYAMDVLSYNETTRDWRVHDGIDIAAQAGTEVCAAAEGTVYTVYADDAMGMTVVIRHDDGYTTTYSSLDKTVKVAPGDKVTLGQTIGTVGNTAIVETATGDHLHFSVSCNGEPIDPEAFFALGQ